MRKDNIYRGLFIFLITCFPAFTYAQSYTNYIEMKAFVTNFGEVETGPLRFMKAEVTLQTNTESNRLDIEKHMSHVRNDLIFLFKSQNEANLATIEAQNVLATKALEVVQTIYQQETGLPQVEDLFFTSLVIQ